MTDFNHRGNEFDTELRKGVTINYSPMTNDL